MKEEGWGKEEKKKKRGIEGTGKEKEEKKRERQKR
jgi:hypothetical protein